MKTIWKGPASLGFNLKGTTPEMFCRHRLGLKMASQQQQQQQAGGPMSQPGLQQPASIQQQQQLSQQQDIDPVHKFRMLIPQLKESLQVIRTNRDANAKLKNNRLIYRLQIVRVFTFIYLFFLYL